MGFEKQPVETIPEIKIATEEQPEILTEEKIEKPASANEIWQLREETLKQMHWGADKSLQRIVNDIVELTDKIALDERTLSKQEEAINKNKKDINQAIAEALSSADNEKVKSALSTLRQKLDAEHEVFRKELDNVSSVNESTGWFRGKEKEKIHTILNAISQGVDEIVRLEEKLPELQERVKAEKIYLVVGEEPKGETEHLIKLAIAIKEELATKYQPIAETVEKLSPDDQKQFSGDFKVHVMGEFNRVYNDFVAKAEADIEKKQEQLKKKGENDIFDNRKSNNFRQIAEHVLFRGLY